MGYWKDKIGHPCDGMSEGQEADYYAGLREGNDGSYWCEPDLEEEEW